MFKRMSAALVILFAASAPAAGAAAAALAVEIEIPRLAVAEYHRPYVAAWIEDGERRVAANLALWYDVDLKNGEGTTWLKDLRQWWRRAGRSIALPVDGVTGATRPPGMHALRFERDAVRLAGLQPGAYELVVEAAREVGGREIVRVPFTWPPQRAEDLQALGAQELGAVRLALRP